MNDKTLPMNPLDVRVPPGHIESDSNQKLDDEVDVLPTTLAQRRFLDYDRTHPGNPAYNIAIRIQLEGKFEPAVMERAANELVRRHEMLRTFFSDVDGEPVQVVLPNLKVSLTIVDLREVPEDDRPAKVDGLSKAEARTRFDLSHVPLLRFKLLRLSDSHHILLMTIHQTVSDCWSVGILSHELGVLYAAYKRGEESPLPELPLQYGDYAVWQKKWIENHGLGNQLDFWKSQLVDLPVLEVPTDRPRPSIASNNGDIFSVLLPKSLTEPLKELSHRQGCTFFMLSLAAINVLLQRLTGRTDIPVGTITAGRTRVEMEPLIGRFINPLVIRTDLSGDPLFLDLLAQVMNRVIDALENRDIPYECVVQAIKPATDPTRHPVFQINFVHQRAFVRPLNMSGLSFSGIPSVSAGAIYDLYFFMVERPEGWRLSCEYNTDLYERESVRKMIDHYRAILEGIATDAARPISALPWATSASPSSNPQLLITRQDETKPVVKRSFIAPKNETETKLELLWRKVIRAERVSVDSDFFDEGGHSVLAARLLYMVHKEFGVQLSFGAFLKAPTIAKLAERLQQGEEVWTDRILVFRNGRPKPPLIIIDPFHRYHDVASYFGPDFSVIGLSSPPVRDFSVRFTVEELAANMYEMLLKYQPDGPYVLAGWCDSGIVAYELARLIRARGGRVPLLVLIDSWNPILTRHVRSSAGVFIRLRIRSNKLRLYVRKYRRAGVKALLGDLAGRARSLGARWKSRVASYFKKGKNSEVSDRELVGHLVVSHYVPKPLDTKLLLVTTEPLGSCKVLYRQGWGDLAGGGLTIRHLDCDHTTLFVMPFAEQLAQAITEKILELPDNGTVKHNMRGS